MAKVIISDVAAEDMIDIWCYVSDDSERAADRLIDTFEKMFRDLAASPGMGRVREEFGSELLSFPVKSYLVFYREVAGGIEVARVISGFRDLDAQF